ncbi:MAG: phosphoribosylformylglycinamidine synthase subunit PurL [Fimbriimonadaceae bacterium]
MALVTSEVYSAMGLNAGEYALILKLLGRAPSPTELGMFAVMWSEHCGYKYSRPVLAAFKRYKAALEGEGFENAGIVELGDGLGVTMKVESHNHPSAVEPYQGAATGVGGIIRDILTMGARPIASLNSLRFGTMSPGAESDETCARNRYLFEHVVAGIAGYGNCVGVPTVGGEVGFHPRYSGNPLVNAMCVGVLNLDSVTTAAAAGDMNPVLYLGSSTGKDGIHGATFASDALSEDNDAKRPNVQIGDPFAEKLLIEATLEALATGAIVAIQDMGAAGLTCSTVEMASKGRVGMEIDLDLVPMRETDMSAYDLMLSESQERMLAVAVRGREAEVLDVFHRWGLPAKVIGTVRTGGRLVIRRFGKVEADLDPTALTDHCPTYTTEAKEPAEVVRARAFDVASVPEADPVDALLTLLNAPEIASKQWVYRQYDQQVQTQTVLGPGAGDAAVLSPRGTGKGIALSLDGNSRATSLDPFVGGMLCVVEAARNVACTGARPKALTDGLNFGSPENPEVYWQFREAVNGIAQAAEALGTPVVSGNVSFYNRSDLGEIPPTPIIGMVGLLEDVACALPSAPSAPAGLSLALVSARVDRVLHEGLGASAYLAFVHGIEDGRPTPPNLVGEAALCEFLAVAAHARLLASAHDCSEGGIAVTLAEIAIAAGAGLHAEIPEYGFSRADAAMFGEVPGRVVVSFSRCHNDALRTMAAASGLDFAVVGGFDDAFELDFQWRGGPWVALDLGLSAGVYTGAVASGIHIAI